MNKKINKIIISISCIVILAIVGFSIYSMNTKNTSTEVKTEEKQEAPTVVAKGDEPKTDQDTELTDTDKEGMSAVNVFMQGFQEVFNVENTKTINVDNYNFLTENAKKQVKGFFEYYNSSAVKNLSIVKTVRQHENTNNKDGYLIYYKNTLVCDNKEDLLENTESLGFATAWVLKDTDNKYKIDFFYSNKFNSLDE